MEDNLRNLGLETMDVVNLRSMLDVYKPAEGSLEPQLEALMALKERGLIRHIGLSNVTARQVADARKLTPIACVQNMYNLANRNDDALVDELAELGIAWVPFFPLGGSRLCSQHSLMRWPQNYRPRRCRWRWHGCSGVLLISC